LAEIESVWKHAGQAGRRVVLVPVVAT